MLKSPEDLSSADLHHQNGRGEGGRVGETAYSLAMGGALLLHWQKGTTLVAAGSLKDS